MVEMDSAEFGLILNLLSVTTGFNSDVKRIDDGVMCCV